MNNRTAFILAASKIERDVRLRDLTDVEIDALCAAVKAADAEDSACICPPNTEMTCANAFCPRKTDPQ